MYWHLQINVETDLTCLSKTPIDLENAGPLDCSPPYWLHPLWPYLKKHLLHIWHQWAMIRIFKLNLFFPLKSASILRNIFKTLFSDLWWKFSKSQSGQTHPITGKKLYVLILCFWVTWWTTPPFIWVLSLFLFFDCILNHKNKTTLFYKHPHSLLKKWSYFSFFAEWLSQ